MLAGDVHPSSWHHWHHSEATSALENTSLAHYKATSPAAEARAAGSSAKGQGKAGAPRGFISEEPEHGFPSSTARCAGRCRQGLAAGGQDNHRQLQPC